MVQVKMLCLISRIFSLSPFNLNLEGWFEEYVKVGFKVSEVAELCPMLCYAGDLVKAAAHGGQVVRHVCGGESQGSPALLFRVEFK